MRQCMQEMNSGRVWLHMALICFGYFQASWQCLLISQQMLGQLKDYKPICNVLQSVFLTCGCVLAGVMLRFGRRRMVVLLDIVMYFAGLIALFMTPVHLFIGRILYECARGASLTIYLIYFKEMMPKSFAGFTIGMLQAVYFLAHSTHALVEYLLKNANINLDENHAFISRVLIFVGLMMCLVHFLVMALVLQHESPKYLLEAMRSKDAYAILSLLYKQKDSAQAELDFVQSTNEFKQFSSVRWIDLLSGKQRRILLLCCALILLRNTTGLYSPWPYFDPTGWNKNLVLIVLYVCQSIASVTVGLLFEYLPFRKVTIIGFALNIAVNLLTLSFGILKEAQEQISWFNAALATSVVSSLLTTLTIGPISWLLTVQLLPDKGVSIVIAVGWISMSFIFVPFYADPDFSSFYVLQPLYIAFCILGLFCSVLFLKATVGTNEAAIKKAYFNK